MWHVDLTVTIGGTHTDAGEGDTADRIEQQEPRDLSLS